MFRFCPVATAIATSTPTPGRGHGRRRTQQLRGMVVREIAIVAIDVNARYQLTENLAAIFFGDARLSAAPSNSDLVAMPARMRYAHARIADDAEITTKRIRHGECHYVEESQTAVSIVFSFDIQSTVPY